MRGTWTFLIGGALAAAPAAALAQKASDSADSERREINRVILHQVARDGDAKKVVAYLGVSTSPVTPALGRQLRMPEGMGLVIDFVEPGSPARAAGLAQFDVLQKLDDQLLINPEQFAVLVRHYEKGDEVKITIMRDGQTKTLSAKLDTRTASAIDTVNPTYAWQGEDQHGIEILNLSEEKSHPDGVGGKIRLVRSGKQDEVVQWEDSGREFSIRTADGGSPTLRVEAKGGKIIFDGPIETDEQRSKAPPELMKQVKEVRDQVRQFPAMAGPTPEKPDGPAQGYALKAPLLGDLPGVGPLFTVKVDGKTKGERRQLQVVDENGRVMAVTQINVDIRPDKLIEDLSQHIAKLSEKHDDHDDDDHHDGEKPPKQSTQRQR